MTEPLALVLAAPASMACGRATHLRDRARRRHRTNAHSRGSGLSRLDRARAPLLAEGARRSQPSGQPARPQGAARRGCGRERHRRRRCITPCTLRRLLGPGRQKIFKSFRQKIFKDSRLPPQPRRCRPKLPRPARRWSTCWHGSPRPLNVAGTRAVPPQAPPPPPSSPLRPPRLPRLSAPWPVRCPSLAQRRLLRPLSRHRRLHAEGDPRPCQGRSARCGVRLPLTPPPPRATAHRCRRAIVVASRNGCRRVAASRRRRDQAEAAVVFRPMAPLQQACCLRCWRTSRPVWREPSAASAARRSSQRGTVTNLGTNHLRAAPAVPN